MSRDFSRSSNCSKTRSLPTQSHSGLFNKYPIAVFSEGANGTADESCFIKLCLSE